MGDIRCAVLVLIKQPWHTWVDRAYESTRNWKPTKYFMECTYATVILLHYVGWRIYASMNYVNIG